MFTYESNTDLQSIAKQVAAAKRVVVTTHAKPDGDAMGSTLALKRALDQRLDIEILLIGPVTAPMRAIAGSTSWTDADQQMPKGGEDLVLLVDTGAFNQVEPIADWFRERHDRVVVLDHHTSGDDIGATRLVDPTAASASMLVMELLESMGVSLEGGPGERCRGAVLRAGDGYRLVPVQQCRRPRLRNRGTSADSWYRS